MHDQMVKGTWPPPRHRSVPVALDAGLPPDSHLRFLKLHLLSPPCVSCPLFWKYFPFLSCFLSLSPPKFHSSPFLAGKCLSLPCLFFFFSYPASPLYEDMTKKDSGGARKALRAKLSSLVIIPGIKKRHLPPQPPTAYFLSPPRDRKWNFTESTYCAHRQDTPYKLQMYRHWKYTRPQGTKSISALSHTE